MDKEKKNRVAKEAAKALGVTGASAAIGAAVLDPEATFDKIVDYGWENNSPLANATMDTVFNDGGLYDKMKEIPNFGIGLNAAASGIGGLAAYGLLRGAIKGAKKLDKKMFQRKVALHNATNNIKVNNS